MLRRKPPKERLLNLISKQNWQRVGSLVSRWHPADIADLINNAPHDDKPRVFSLVKQEVKPEVLREIENIAESGIPDSLPDGQIASLVERMAPDDAADFLYELPPERRDTILSSVRTEEATHIRKLLRYKSDTAGGIMTTDVVAMQKDQTVQDALHAIAYVETHEPFVNVNIVDRNNRLIGYVDLWELLREKDRQKSLGDLVHTEFAAADVTTDQEEVARIMAHYDLSVLPVIDQNGKLVGRVTSDDVIDVVQEEASEDIFRLAGSDDIELETVSTLRTCMVRLPWLMITLCGGFLTTLILSAFHSHITNIIILASFVPVILAMGGNTGIQSSTLLIRSMALGEYGKQRLRSLLLKEVLSGASMGLISGTLIGIFAAVLTFFSPDEISGRSPWIISATVAIALFVSMTFAATFGALVPVMLDKLKVDPAVASGPFVTITNDIAAALIYFATTLLLITGLG